MLVSHPTLERSVSGVYGHQVLPPNRSCPKKVDVAETQTQGTARVAPRHAGMWCMHQSMDAFCMYVYGVRVRHISFHIRPCNPLALPGG